MQNITVFGIVVAVIIILIGLRILLRKQDDAAPSLDSPLQFNADSQQPIIPRHVRDQLQHEAAIAQDAKATAEQSVEPDALKITVNNEASDTMVSGKDVSTQAMTPDASLSIQTVEQAAVDKGSANGSIQSTSNIASEQTMLALNDAEQADVTVQTGIEQQNIVDNSINAESAATQSEQTKTVEAETEASAEYQLNPQLEAVEIQEFEDESSLLDKHLHEQQKFDDQSTLANAETIIALNVYPHPRKALSGDKTLKVLLKYGLRFGELSCFHRYEEEDNGGGLMFSVLRIGDEGPHGFDLESLSCEQVQGLAFFLALPHRNVQKGFDTMVSIAGLIAREIDGTVYDENNLEFTPQLKEHWRHKAIDYRRQN